MSAARKSTATIDRPWIEETGEGRRGGMPLAPFVCLEGVD